MTAHVPVLGLSLLVLSGCFPVDVYHKAGGSLQRQKSDLLSCQTRALREAPADTRVARTPTYYVPARQVCKQTAQGLNCHVFGGYWEGGDLYSYDANELLRAKVQEGCMRTKGYNKVRLPRCERKQIAGAQVSAKMPQLSAASCVAQGVGGGWVILAP